MTTSLGLFITVSHLIFQRYGFSPPHSRDTINYCFLLPSEEHTIKEKKKSNFSTWTNHQPLLPTFSMLSRGILICNLWKSKVPSNSNSWITPRTSHPSVSCSYLVPAGYTFSPDFEDLEPGDQLISENE